jgi:cytochrome c-type biogenesis protein CcmH
VKAFAASLMLFAAGLAFGQADEVQRPDPQVEQRLKSLAEELRCLVCQNQTIADSNAPLALDLRNQIRQQVAQGKSDAQIRDYLVERYGDFVLYRPPLKASTLLLWIGPFVLIAVGAIVFAVVIRRRPAANAPAAAARPRAEIEALLEKREVKPPARPTSGGRPSGKR